MREKLKATGLLTLTLTLGVTLGVIGSRTVFEKRARDFQPRKQPLSTRIPEKLRLDEEQAQEMAPILEKYDALFEEMHQRHQSEIKLMRQSIKKEIEPHLTDEQKNRMQQHRRRRHGRRGRKAHFNTERKKGQQQRNNQENKQPRGPQDF